MNRAIALSVGLLALAAVPAAAADIPMKAPMVAPVVAPGYNWTGFYVGANAGYMTLSMAQSFADIEVNAFEPIPELAEILSRAAGNYGRNRIKVYNAALSNSNAPVQLHLPAL